jgi:hypothetical protein
MFEVVSIDPFENVVSAATPWKKAVSMTTSFMGKEDAQQPSCECE